jgi:hypothetical protein
MCEITLPQDKLLILIKELISPKNQACCGASKRRVLLPRFCTFFVDKIVRKRTKQ